MSKSSSPNPGLYPGFGLPLFYQDLEKIKHHYLTALASGFVQAYSQMLLVREVAMMVVMDRLSDKPDFHIMVYDDDIVSRWKAEVLAIPVDQFWNEIVKQRGISHPKKTTKFLDEECIDYCINELRTKAEFFKRTGFISTLDANASVCKSDTVVDQSLHDELRAAFARLQRDLVPNPDWHPGTRGRVQDLVHPSLHPLVYGRTRGFKDEVVGVDDASDTWAGKGDIIPPPNEPLEPSDWSEGWSTKFQWLPSNVKLHKDGTVRITSYINNLHPVKYRDIYRTIEKVIEKAIPAWDTCLAVWDVDSLMLTSAARFEARFPSLENADDYSHNWIPLSSKDYPPGIQCKPTSHRGNQVEGENTDKGYHASGTDPEGYYYYAHDGRDLLWKMTREPGQPACPPFRSWNYSASEKYSLQKNFEKLQIIVKMASIELTPDKPWLPASNWHVEGQANERIVGTALYYLDSDNITTNSLHFRMKTDVEQDGISREIGEDQYEFLERIFGTKFDSDGHCLQNYGSVKIKQGRLLCFPNTFQHLVSSFELEDMKKPGHCRFITLWLIDPNTPIISTANVPPQQRSWWVESSFGNLTTENASNVPRYVAEHLCEKIPDHPGLNAAATYGRTLPAELSLMVAKGLEDTMPMSLEEAKELRVKLMKARAAFRHASRDEWQGQSYSFRDH